MSLSGSKTLLLLLCLCGSGCNEPDASESFVAFGDSHIAKYDVGYYFSNKQINNQGTNGLLTHEIEAALRASESEATRLILHAGTNDYIKAFNDGISEDDFINDLEIDMANLLDATNTFSEVIIISSLPVNSDYFNTSFYNLERVEKFIEQQCAARPECKFVSSKFLWDEAGFLNRNFTTDLIHLNADGYHQLSAAIYHEMD